eukprot:970854-Rhodomonas_salina.4
MAMRGFVGRGIRGCVQCEGGCARASGTRTVADGPGGCVHTGRPFPNTIPFIWRDTMRVRFHVSGV